MSRNSKVVLLLEKRRLRLEKLLARWEQLEKTGPQPRERFPCYRELSGEQQYLFDAIVEIVREEMSFASCNIPLEREAALTRVMTMKRAELYAEAARRKAYNEHMGTEWNKPPGVAG